MKVQYKNPLVKSEDILKYIESNHKIRYWLTLKLPIFMRTKEYTIDVIKNNLFTPFISILTKRANDKHLFVLGVIEDYYLNEGFHAHVLVATSKEMHVIRDAWIMSIKYACQNLNIKEEILHNMIMESDKKSSLTWTEDLIRIRPKPLITLIDYMFKNYGLNKGHGFFSNKTDLVLINAIETNEYKAFLKLNINKGLSLAILIYAIGDLFKYNFSFLFLLGIINEKEELIKKMLQSIDEYLIENKEYLFENEHSSEKINDVIKQISIELVASEFLYLIKANYSFVKKEKIFDTYMELLKKRKKNNLTYNEYILEYFTKGFKKYMSYIGCNLEKLKELEYVTTYEKWAEQLTPKAYIFDIVHCSINWIIAQLNITMNRVPFTKETIVKEFKKIWEFYIKAFDKELVLELQIDDYFVLFTLLVEALEKNLNLKLPLLTPVKVLDDKDELKTYFVWSTTKSKHLKESLKTLIEKRDDVKNNLNFLDLKKIAIYKILFGTLFIRPKKWVYNGNKDLNKNYTGGYILNNVFNLCSFIHQDEQVLGKFEPDNYEEFISNINSYQEQSYKIIFDDEEKNSYESIELGISNIYSSINNRIDTIKIERDIKPCQSIEIEENEEKGYIQNEIYGQIKYDKKKKEEEKWKSVKEKKEMEKIRKEIKEKWIKEIKEKEIWNIMYIDWRGRLYITGIYNYQNDKEIRYRIYVRGKEIGSNPIRGDRAVNGAMLWKM